jgi:transmembrane E3 ubiquitin-protein ligase
MSTPQGEQPAPDPIADVEAADSPVARPRPRSSIPSFLFLFFLLFMMTNNNGDELVARSQYRDSLASLEWQLGNYSAWLNGPDVERLNFTMVCTPIIAPYLM